MMDAHRAARLDLGGIGAELARRILAECAPAVDAEVRRLTPALRHTHGIDADDLRSLGQIAVLEAYLTHQEGRGRTLRSWAGQVVRWRLSEAIESSQAECVSDPEVDSDTAGPAEDPAESYDSIERVVWLEQTLGTLPPRHRTLIAQQLRGEAQRHLGATLGLGRTRVSKETQNAVAALRARAIDAGLWEE